MTLTDDPGELLDLVDDQDRVIGTVSRGAVWQNPDKIGGRVRSSDCFMVNDDGLIWVPRRSPKKKLYPNGLDFSVGEHVHSGETYEQAMIRGFEEELGLAVEPKKLERIAILDLRTFGLLPYSNAIFVYRNNTVPEYNKDDFVSYEWLEPNEFMRRLESGESAKSNIRAALGAYIALNRGKK